MPSYWEVAEKKQERIMERRIVRRGNRLVSQVLVKWRNADESEANWEDFHVLKGKYPKVLFNELLRQSLELRGKVCSGPEKIFFVTKSFTYT